MIQIDISKCTGCRCCENSCTFFHKGTINRNHSRIKVQNIFATGLDGPVVCQQCLERYCLACPSKAISVGKLGQIIVSPTVCTLCGFCEINCPIGAIELNQDYVYVCDLCSGDPRCVKACTEGAIQFIADKIETVSLLDFKEKSKKMNSSEKRVHYIKTIGVSVRKNWRKKNG